ncbi:hypothetical protein [Acetobacterium wieringae]|uniref:hypothetical protein n=1 Tax=Acetobacterium wieringae TaxID=52694 RepID=UPI00315885E1
MKVSGNTITMINGDSETISVSAIDVTGASAAFMPGDTVYFTVKKYTSDTTPTIQKIITEFSDGEAIVELFPEDTIDIPGGYIYDIQLNRADGSVTTIIEPSQFLVERGVTT